MHLGGRVIKMAEISQRMVIWLQLCGGPVFCLLLGVSSDYAQPITGQVNEVTCPVIGRAQPELTPSKRQKTGPGGRLNKKDGLTRYGNSHVKDKTS